MRDGNVYKGNGLWIDPLNEPPGLLLSDQIAFYAKTCEMITPFSEDDLRPSYYTLHVGSEYWVGRERKLLDKGDRIVIEPNGFVYIQVKEFFNLPFYMVASYSLCVKQVYRGLMLDNGLQIDPGYRGIINVPVYNFTDDKKYFKAGDPFLAVEFIRTTRFQPQDKVDSKNLDDMYEQTFIGFNGHPLKTFKKINSRPVPDYFEPAENNTSSVLRVRHDVDLFKNDTANNIDCYKTSIRQELDKHKTHVEKTIDKVEKISLVGIGGILVGMVIGVFTHFYWQESKFSALSSKYDTEKVLTQFELHRSGQESSQIKAIRESLDAVSSRQNQSEDSIKALQDKIDMLARTFESFNSDRISDPNVK